MKIVSFFTEKGGTGKTTFNIMLASYLHSKGKKVIVLDFDYPEFHLSEFRDRELLIYEKKERTISRTPFLIQKINEISFSGESGSRLIRAIESVRNSYDYLILDFPGHLLPDDAICILSLKGMIDEIIVPVTRDPIEVNSARKLVKSLVKNGQKCSIFFNRVKFTSSQRVYEELAVFFGGLGAIVHDFRIKDSVNFQKESELGYIRSTLDFPSEDIVNTVPAVIELFDDIISI